MQERQFRNWIRTILEDSSQDQRVIKEDFVADAEVGYYGWQPSEGSFHRAFIAPFTNILKQVVNLGRIVLNIATFQFTLLFTLSSHKQKALLDNFKKRQEKIDGDMEAILDGMRKEAGDDMDLFQFLVNPGAYVSVKAALGTAAATKAFIYNTGLRDVVSIVPGIGVSKTATVDDKGGAGEKSAPAPAPEPEEEPGLLGKLERIFFIAHYDRPGDLISEAKGKSEAVDELNAFFNQSGLQDKFASTAQDMIEIRREYVDGIVKVADEQAQISIDLTNARSPDEMKDILKKANTSGFKMGGSELASFNTSVNDSVKKLMLDPKAKKEIADMLKQKSSGEISDDMIKEEAVFILTMRAKEKLVGVLHEGVKSLQAQALRAILDGAVPRDQWPQLSESVLGKQYVEIHDDAIKSIKALTGKAKK